MNDTVMTMSANRWSIASAKAGLSRMVQRAQRVPQLIENRGEPVAVVLAVDEYRRLSERRAAIERYRSFLDLSATLRAEGGAELKIPRRRSRPAPFRR